MIQSNINGLVLAGGFSRRMGCDKALLRYHGMPQARWTGRLLSGFCARVYYSCRAGQDLGEGEDISDWRIHDTEEGQGPIAGMLAAHKLDPGTAWLVVACDLPRLDADTLAQLTANRDADKVVTAYRSFHDSLPEPLCALYEPPAFTVLAARFASGCRCPRRVLIDLGDQVKLLELPNAHALDNANTPDEASAFETNPGK